MQGVSTMPHMTALPRKKLPIGIQTLREISEDGVEFCKDQDTLAALKTSHARIKANSAQTSGVGWSGITFGPSFCCDRQ